MSGPHPSLWCARLEDTELFGRRLGEAAQSGQLLSLEGPLGAGKTSLVRGVAIGLGADPREVRSPTFVLHHVYPGTRAILHHLDLYRLGPGAGVDLLDVETLLEDGVVAVEWGELADLARWDPIRIEAGIEARGGRTFTLQSPAPEAMRAAWPDRA